MNLGAPGIESKGLAFVINDLAARQRPSKPVKAKSWSAKRTQKAGRRVN